MAEMIDEEVLCGASCYSKLFYMNEKFDNLPQEIKDELKIMCVLYTEDIGGTLQLFYDEEGNLNFRSDKNSDDFLYDEIGSVLKIRQYQREKKELLEQLENYYKVGKKSGLF